MKNNNICNPSVATSAQHEKEIYAQYRVMRDMNLTLWDPQNTRAMKYLSFLISGPENPRKNSNKMRNLVR